MDDDPTESGEASQEPAEATVERVARAAREAADEALRVWRAVDKYAHQYDAVACRQAISIALGPAIKAAIAAMPEPWQPIASAPKSTHTGSTVHGIYLLGYCPEEGATPARCISVIWWEPLLNGGEWFAEGAMGVKPTHWQPLPPPPKQETGSGK